MPRPPKIPVRRSQPIKKAALQPQSEVTAQFKQGLALHQHGQLAQAKQIYEQVLAKHPSHFDALHLSGVIAAQSKNPTLAVELIGKAIQINPKSPEAYSNRGAALKELKRLEEAIASYDRAVEIKPDYAEAYFNRGVTLKELNRFEEAIASYDRAVEIKPDYAEAYYNRGNALKELKRLEEALASYEKAIEIKPGYAAAYSNRANALQELKQVEEALASYDRAIAIKPDYADAYSNRGNALKELNRLEEALASYDRAIEIKPDYAEAYSNRGNALKALNRVEAAIASYDRAIEIKPDYAEAYSNRGNALKELNRLEEALASYDRAIEIKPDYAATHSNRGFVLQELKRLVEALASYDKAIAIKPDYAEAYWNKSLALLVAGEFAQGWELYEWRWKKDTFTSPKRNFSQPLWLGAEDIAGKTILLHAEQGLGDTLQFFRYAKLVKALGVKVILEVPKALLGLLSGLEGVDELIEKGKALPAFDYQCPLLSLPLAFKTDLNNIPSPGAYLKSDPKKVKQWQKKLGPKKKPRIGVVWSSVSSFKDDAKRSMRLEEFIQCIPLDEYEVVCLQKEIKEEDKAYFDSLKGQISFYGPELKDFADTAALASCMDLVVSTCTSVPHLTAALGVPTWVLLSYVPDWRWMLEREDSPWYASVRLFRQDLERNWPLVLCLIKQELKNTDKS